MNENMGSGKTGISHMGSGDGYCTAVRNGREVAAKASDYVTLRDQIREDHPHYLPAFCHTVVREVLNRLKYAEDPAIRQILLCIYNEAVDDMHDLDGD